MTSTLNLYATEPEAWVSAAQVARRLGLDPADVKPAARRRPTSLAGRAARQAEVERAWIEQCLADAPPLSDRLREEIAELMARELRAVVHSGVRRAAEELEAQ